MKATRHRAVLVRQHAKEADTLESISKLSSAHRTIVCSHACRRLVVATRAGQTSTDVAFAALLNLATGDALNDSKLTIILESIVELLKFELTKKTSNKGPRRGVFAVGAQEGRVCPLVQFQRLQPDRWPLLLLALQRLLDIVKEDAFSSRDAAEDIFLFLYPLIRTNLINTEYPHHGAASKNALVALLGNLVNGPIDDQRYDELRRHLCFKMVHIARNMASNEEDLHGPFFSVLDALVRALDNEEMHAILIWEEWVQLAREVYVLLLQSLCESHYLSKPTSPLLHLLSKLITISHRNDRDLLRALFEDRKLGPSYASISWIAFSYVLLESDSIEEQELAVTILCLIGDTEDEIQRASQSSACALLPLFQVISEANQELAPELLPRTYEVIERINQKCTSLSSEAQGLDIDVPEIVLGPFSVLRCLVTTYQSEMQPQLATSTGVAVQMSTSMRQERFDTLTKSAIILALSRQILTYLDTTQSMERLDSLLHLVKDTANQSDLSVPFAHQCLHMLQLSTAIPPVKVHILFSVLPQLVSMNDLVVTPQIIKVISAMFGYNGGDANTLSPTALRMLFEVWKHNPSIWRILHSHLGNWVEFMSVSQSASHGNALSSDRLVYQMEIATLATMRDCCALRPKETGEDLILLWTSMLQSKVDWSSASIGLVLEGLIECIKADIVECRASWNLLISYIANFAAADDKLLQMRLCAFYALVPARSDASELYIDFRQHIVSSFIFPLLSHSDVAVANAALHALSQYPVQEISICLPEAAPAYVAQIDSMRPSRQGHSRVLGRLMLNELEHLRRGLFNPVETRQNKETRTEDQAQLASIASDISRHAQTISNNWREGAFHPGVKSGVAAATVMILTPDAPEMRDMSAFQTYLEVLMGDVSFNDHAILRLRAIAAWQDLVQKFLVAVPLDERDARLSSMHSFLIDKFNTSETPGYRIGCLLATTGLVAASVDMELSMAISLAESHARGLVNMSKDCLAQSLTVHYTEDTAYAINQCIGPTICTILENEQVVWETMSHLRLVAGHGKSSNVEPCTTSTFAAAYSFGQIAAVLETSPERLAAQSPIIKDSLAWITEECTRSANTEVCAGLLMGYASASTESSSLVLFAHDVLDHSPDYNIGTVAGSAWVLSNSSSQSEKQLHHRLQLLTQALVMAQQSGIAGWRACVSIAYATVLERLTRLSSTSPQIGVLTDNIEQRAETLLSGENSANDRQTAVVILGALCGVAYGREVELESMRPFVLSTQFPSAVRTSIIDSLRSAAGILGQATVDSRTSRMANIVLGAVIASAQYAQHFRRAVSIGDTAVVKITEPSDYSRFPKTNSFLRATFETLFAYAEEPDKHRDQAPVFLQALQCLSHPVPPVNWNLLTNLSAASDAVYIECLQFAIKHCFNSISLTEFLVACMNTIRTEQRQEVLELLCDVGVGRILELSGLHFVDGETAGERVSAIPPLRRGLQGLAKKSVVSPARCAEIIDYCLTSAFAEASSVATEHQTAILKQLTRHLSTSAELQNMDGAHISLNDQLRIRVTQIVFEGQLRTIKHGVLLHQDQIRLLRAGVPASQLSADDLLASAQESPIVVLALSEMCKLGLCDAAKVVPQLILALARCPSASAIPLQEAEWCIEAIISATSSEQSIQWIMRLLDVGILMSASNDETAKHAGLHLVFALLERFSWSWSSIHFSHGDHALLDAPALGFCLGEYLLRADSSTVLGQIIKRLMRLLNKAIRGTHLYIVALTSLRQVIGASKRLEAVYKVAQDEGLWKLSVDGDL